MARGRHWESGVGFEIRTRGRETLVRSFEAMAALSLVLEARWRCLAHAKRNIIIAGQKMKSIYLVLRHDIRILTRQANPVPFQPRR